jgi:hypothetical protein
MAVMIDKETKEAVPFTAFVNAERLAKDVAAVTDAARGKWLTVTGWPWRWRATTTRSSRRRTSS